MLQDRICSSCNGGPLGRLDEQLARCGPEAFLRRVYGVKGRSTHKDVNPFYRGSAGGRRLEVKTWDPQLGLEVLLECEGGKYELARQLIFVEKSGRVHHLPIREDTTSVELRAAFQRLGVNPPFETHYFVSPEETLHLERLLRETWPSVSFGDLNLGSDRYAGAVVNMELTDRYFRALTKIGFHYFLTQFTEYSGDEQMFSDVRNFIIKDDAGPVDRANDFVGIRQHPLLAEMFTGARPAGWRAHVLAAEIRRGECLAHVQLFLSNDWPAPTYTIRLARDAAIVRRLAAAHMYMYYPGGLRGKYSGETLSLESTTVDFPAPPLAPVIESRR